MNVKSIILPGSQVVIEPATWRDLNPLRQLERACFPQDAWPLLDLIGVLTMPGVVRLRAMAGQLMVGFIAGDFRKNEDTAWIATICVLPEYRRQGIGSGLLQRFESQVWASKICLSVRVSNDPAIKMYEELGYTRAGMWRHYYEGGEDALVMEKNR